jgi:hypothetical protein
MRTMQNPAIAVQAIWLCHVSNHPNHSNHSNRSRGLVMKINAKHWGNNAAGLFMVAVLFFVATIAVNRSFPSAATSALLWLFALMGVAALALWIWCSYQTASRTGVHLVFESRRPRR